MYRLYDLRRVMSGSLNIDLFTAKPAANKSLCVVWLVNDATGSGDYVCGDWLRNVCGSMAKPGAGGIVPTLNSPSANDWALN